MGLQKIHFVRGKFNLFCMEPGEAGEIGKQTEQVKEMQQ